MWNFLAPPAFKPEQTGSEADERYRRLRWQVFIGIFIGYAGFYIVRKNFSMAIPMLAPFGFEKGELGVVLSMNAIAYGFSKFVMASISDRSNAQRFLPLGLILAAISMMFMIVPVQWIGADNKGLAITLMAVLNFLVGWFNGMGWPPCGRVMTHWFSIKERGTWMSFWNCAHNVGGALVGPMAVYGAAWFGSWFYGADEKSYFLIGTYLFPAAVAILIAIIALTCMGSLYTALTNIREAIKPNDPDGAFLFLKLFTVSDGTLPSFAVFISFLGPLLGISLGFDAINSEQNKGTLSRILSQPIHRDYLINAKFVAALAVIGIMLFMLGFLVMGFGLIAIGIPPTAEEFMRVVFFLFVSLFYVAFWLNLSIFFSIRFKQAATSALACVAIWLFFSVFYNMIINLVGKALSPSAWASDYQVIAYQRFMLNLLRFAPSELFNEATMTLLMPSVRSLGPLTMEQVHGAIPSPLPLGQSLLVVWPQLTGLIAATVVCFALSYVSFMRKEVRSR